MRLLATIAAAALVAAWADAQQAGMLGAAERLRQLHANRALIDTLVQRNLVLAHANRPLERAEACRLSMIDLARELEAAIRAQDASRVAELGDHLTAIVRDALTPALTDAIDQIPTDSPDRERLVQLHKAAAEEFARIELKVPRTDVLGRSQHVKRTLADWHSARVQLEKLLSAAPAP